MGDSVRSLEVKLARINVKSYLRRRDGQTQHVDAYNYRRQGSGMKSDVGAPVDRRAVDKLRDGLSERAKLNIQGKKTAAPKGEESKPTGKGTKDDPIVTDSVEEAAKALAEDKHVRLKQARSVSTLIDKLADLVDEAKAKGEKAPTYDLCKVTVENTNLFCVESKGIPRIKMPQLSGKPTPGSQADKMTKNDRGEVNLSEAFAEYLASKDFEITETDIDAKYLRASQNELNGGKVAGMVKAMEAGTFPKDAGRIWVSGDDYVIDGHHRWAATVGAEYKTGESITLPVRQVQTDIITILSEANKFAANMGIAQAAV